MVDGNPPTDTSLQMMNKHPTELEQKGAFINF